MVGYNRIQQEEHHDFYKQWTGDGFPRFLVVEVQHPTPCAQPNNNLTRAPAFLAVCCCCGLVRVCAASYLEFTNCSSVTRTQQRCSIVVLQASGLCNAQLSLPVAAADYDDSYAVNSASQGPWGDAIMHELLPEIESRFRKPIPNAAGV